MLVHLLVTGLMSLGKIFRMRCVTKLGSMDSLTHVFVALRIVRWLALVLMLIAASGLAKVLFYVSHAHFMANAHRDHL